MYRKYRCYRCGDIMHNTGKGKQSITIVLEIFIRIFYQNLFKYKHKWELFKIMGFI